MLSGEIALKNNHYYYRTFIFKLRMLNVKQKPLLRPIPVYQSWYSLRIHLEHVYCGTGYSSEDLLISVKHLH